MPPYRATRPEPLPVKRFANFALIACLSLAAAVAQAAPDVPGYRSRAASRSEADVRVSVAVLSAEESEAVYGVPLAAKSIQPVWIEVENRGDRSYWLMSPGVDPNFFPPSEASEAFATRDTAQAAAERERHFRDLGFRNPVLPGKTVSGFVLTNLHEGAKLVQIDLVASGRVRTFSLVAVVPGLRADYTQSGAIVDDPYPSEQIVNYTDDAAFRAALEALPCCVTNSDGTRNGDPLNLVVIGDGDDAFAAFVRRGWSTTEVTWLGSVIRMVNSALMGDRYPYAPVSDLYLFGRKQDIALQKARDSIHQRNHLRAWKSPMRYRGKSVWVGQISRDIGSRPTLHSPTLTTHKIDPDVDKAALALVGDMVYSQNLHRFGFVAGVGRAPRDAPRENLTTDPYYTRGVRAVLFFDHVPTPITAIEVLPWEAGADALSNDVIGKPSP